MRAKILGALALALLLALSLADTALAGAYGYEIDVNAMKAQEAADTFPVRVVEKKVVEEKKKNYKNLKKQDIAGRTALMYAAIAGSSTLLVAVLILFVRNCGICSPLL